MPDRMVAPSSMLEVQASMKHKRFSVSILSRRKKLYSSFLLKGADRETSLPASAKNWTWGNRVMGLSTYRTSIRYTDSKAWIGGDFPKEHQTLGDFRALLNINTKGDRLQVFFLLGK